jgi:hypothetical protein
LGLAKRRSGLELGAGGARALWEFLQEYRLLIPLQDLRFSAKLAVMRMETAMLSRRIFFKNRMSLSYPAKSIAYSPRVKCNSFAIAFVD